MSNTSKKKKISLNTSKRKIIPMRYKPNLSRSNTSLSQLISIGAYKRRINELVRNNRSLARALQDSRLENAYLSNTLKDFARCSNQMKMYKFKINDMVKTTIMKLLPDINDMVKTTITKLVSDFNDMVKATITKLVSDINDHVKLEDDCFVDDNLNFLQNKGPHERMKIRAPTVECIDEEGSDVSLKNGECETVSNEMQSEEMSNTPEMEPVVSEPEASSANIPDMPPILYIDDSEDHSENISKKQSSKKSKSRSSSRRYVANGQLSLTPELDIDIDFMSRRQNSSRRQTQVFTPVHSVGRSRRASSVGQAVIEHETPKNSLIRRESIPQRKLSPVLMECDQSSKEDVSKLDDMNINTKARGSKNTDISDLQLSSVNTDDSSANINNPAVSSLMVSPKRIAVNNDANRDCTLANCTVLISEDMELTDVVRPDAGIECGRIPADIVKAPFNSSDNLLRVENKVEKEDALSDSKLLAYSEDTEVIPIDEYLDKAEKENHDSIPNVVLPCRNVEPSENAACIDGSPSESSFQRRSSRKRRKVITLEFSSSTDSESEFTPMKPDKKKRIERDTVIYKPLKKSSCENEKNSLASKEVHKVSPSALSVYDLDVSNSKKPVKRSRPRNKPKSSSNKEMAKPLSQKCSITKLKSAECKFSKNDNMDFKHKENQQSKISKPQETIPKILQNNADKLKPPIFTFDLDDIVAEKEKSIRASGDEVSSPKVADSKEMGFKSPGLRRVSFASTDVVCNFTRMSVPKKIVQNEKVHRISKSNFNTFDFNFRDPEVSERKRLTGNINLASGFETENTNSINVPDKNYEDLELKLPKETKVMPTKSKVHTLDADSTSTDLSALEESFLLTLREDLNAAPAISATGAEKNVNSASHKEVTMPQEDSLQLVSPHKSKSFNSECKKISNKKSEKCVLVKTYDNQALKTLDKNPVIPKKGNSHNSNDGRENANSEFVKENLDTRKSIPAHSSGITDKCVDSKSSRKSLHSQKKAQKHSSATLVKNLDTKPVETNLSSPKCVESSNLANHVVESEENATTQPKVQAPGMKESSGVRIKKKPTTLNNIVGDLNSKSDKAAASKEKKEVEDVDSEPPKRKQKRKKVPQPNSGKFYEDVSRLSKCSNSPFQSEYNNPHKVMIQNDFKENMLNDNHCILDNVQADPCVKTKKTQLKNLPPTGNFRNKVPGNENIKDLAQTVHKRGISSVEPCQPSTYKKSSNLRLSVESSPVLRDVINVEENKRGSSRRGKAAVSYKEPKLNVKMRR